MKDQTPRVVVVTGAGRGIGDAISRRLLTDGWFVVAVDRDRAGIDGLVHDYGEERVLAATVDVTDRAAVHALFDTVAARRGRVDALVNNAMWVRYAPIPATTEDMLDGMFAVAVKGTLWCIQAALPLLRRQDGAAIVNVSSPAATRGFPGSLAYSSVKGAVSSMTWQAARELGEEGIRVNGIVPGAVPTPGAREVVDDAGYELRRTMTALGRLGTPEDIAAGVAFLLSADAGYVNGHLLQVDGGL